MLLGETLTIRTLVTADDDFTISSPTITIYNADGTAVVSAATATVDNTDLQAQIVYYAFTPSSAGTHRAVFRVVIGSETRYFEQAVEVLSRPSQAVFSYDQSALGQSTAAGRLATVRLLLTDAVNTTDQPAIYTDAEINAFLTLASNNVYEAAAVGYENWARSRGRLAKMIATSTVKSERWAIETLLNAAKNLRNTNLRTVQTGDIVSSDGLTFLDEIRPTWRNAGGSNAPVE